MKIHEYQAAALFKEAGLPVVEGRVALEVNAALQIAKDIGYPVVLKSQVLVGGRGKAGGIKVVQNNEELKKTFSELKKLKIKGYPVEKILVSRAVDIKEEFYLGLTIDNAKDDAVLIASSAGGVEIEETAKTDPKAIKKFYLQGNKEIDKNRWPEFIGSVFKDPSHRETGTKIFQNLIKVFFQHDCSLAEINPLVRDAQDHFYAVDAKINFDDNALFRHEETRRMRDFRYEDPDEMEAKEHDLSFVKLEGDVGCIVNGAGLAMATMDIIKYSGGEPANFLDVGGGASKEKVAGAFKILLTDKNVKAILVNIFGGIMRCDIVAEGILAAIDELRQKGQIGEKHLPIVVRLEGTNVEKGREILANSSLDLVSADRFEEAAKKVVELAS